MANPPVEQIERLRASLAALEGQRAVLGDAVVEPALAALRAQITALEAERDAKAAAQVPADERRLITILFTDIVGSTALADKLDPEEWRQIVARVHGTAGAAVERCQGQVAQYLGDGLLAFFGAQHPTEADPELAIRAALEFQQAIGQWGADSAVRLRAGIHTGLVVVGELGAETHKEFTATGDAMNLAARLQAAAPPGGVIISHDTYRYVRGVFDVTPQPAITVKGKSEPIRTYLVRRAKPRPFRTVIRGVAGVETRTVGRDRERQALQSAYLDACENRRVVWAQLVAEPGLGKSRLLQDTREWIDLRPETVRLLRARAYAEDARQPFALVRRMWLDRFQIAEDAPLAQAEARWLQQFNGLLGRENEEAAHVLGLLVGLPFEGSPHIGALRHDPQQVKGRALVVSRELLRALRAEMPVEVLLEDLHLADAASIDYFLDVFWDKAGLSPATDSLHGLFMLATARPEWQRPAALHVDPAAGGAPHYLELALAPLADDAARELAHELLQNAEGVPNEIVQQIVERAEGVPYYAEELVNYFIDRGILDVSVEPWRFVPQRLREAPLPATLQHLLLTRLSALSDDERGALQRGAIFGRNFWTGGIQALGARAGDDMLAALQPRGFLQAEPDSSFAGEPEWTFHHNLLRDVTYESVLKRERAALHQKAAEWLEAQARAAGRLDEFAGLLGEHAERAGAQAVAAEWFVRAGERARAQGAPREARQFLDRALSLLPPVARELRWRALMERERSLATLALRELRQADVQALLALAEELDDDVHRAEAWLRHVYLLSKSESGPATLETAEKALRAAERAGNPALQAQALTMLVWEHTSQGATDLARPLVAAALEHARASGDDTTIFETLSDTASYHIAVGDLALAVQQFAEAARIAQRAGDRRGHAVALGNLGYVYALLGLYKLARPALEQSLAVNEAIGQRRTRAYNLQNLGFTCLRIGDGRTARRLIEESLRELTAVGDAHGQAGALLYLGRVAEQAGDAAGAARRFSEALAGLTRSGFLSVTPDCTAGLARCALAQGQLDEAREHAAALWQHLSEQGPTGIELPTLCYQTCADLFDALGDPETSRAAVEAGYRDLMARAEKISDRDWRQSFLDNIPEHRAIVDLWERSQAANR
jgi:class 3 adenylate cyclase/tetratricopeptide (TPR) repeat protein